MQNIKSIYTLTENGGTAAEYTRHYVMLRNEQRPHEVAESLYDTLRGIMKPYELSAGPDMAVYGEEFQRNWTQEVQDTYDDFLAGTGRI